MMYRLCLLFFVWTLLLGCESNSIIRKDEELKVVKFESPNASSRFHKKLENIKENYPKQVIKEYSLIFSFYTIYEVLSDNAIANDAAQACDSNTDGVITENEAWYFNDPGLD